MAVRVHVDTDLGDDPDDLCALAYLLARPDVDVVGVTTVDDADGRRTTMARDVLRLGGAGEVPVASGADEVAAGDLLAGSVAAGAVVLGIGPATTLAAAERVRPGLLGSAHVVLMGGWLMVPPTGFPAWPASRDTNVVRDVPAAVEVRRAAGTLAVVPLAATVQAHLRSRDLPRLLAAGPLGARIARDVEAYRDRGGTTRLAATHARLPDDLALLLHDPLAAAVAVGWPGVTVARRRLRTAPGAPDGRLEPSGDDDRDDRDARDVDLVVGVDGPAFGAHWLSTVLGLRPV